MPPDGDDHAVQHTEADRAPESDHREDKFDAADLPKLRQGREIDQIKLIAVAARIAPSAGMGHDAQDRSEIKDRREQRRRRHNAHQLRAAANRHVHRRSRVGCADRNAPKRPASDIGGAEPRQLGVWIDDMAAFGAELRAVTRPGAEAYQENRRSSERKDH